MNDVLDLPSKGFGQSIYKESSDQSKVEHGFLNVMRTHCAGLFLAGTIVSYIILNVWDILSRDTRGQGKERSLETNSALP